MTHETPAQPLDPIIAELAKHFPNNQDTADAFRLLLQSIDAAAKAVQTASRIIDRLIWGIFLLACVCVAQLLALAIR
jgi:hypothetical protein